VTPGRQVEHSTRPPALGQCRGELPHRVGVAQLVVQGLALRGCRRRLRLDAPEEAEQQRLIRGPKWNRAKGADHRDGDDNHMSSHHGVIVTYSGIPAAAWSTLTPTKCSPA